jgi:hypothetical protein
VLGRAGILMLEAHALFISGVLIVALAATFKLA